MLDSQTQIKNSGVRHSSAGLKRGHKGWRAVSVLPLNISFEAQDEDEVIYILSRKHIVTNLGWINNTVVAGAVPIIAYLVIDGLSRFFTQTSFFAGDFFRVVPFNLIVMIGMFYYSGLITLAFANFLDWVYNVYIVTNERIIHLSFKILSGNSIAEAPLKNIIDVSQRKLGFFPSFFDYGDILVQTAARQTQFDMRQIPDPEWFASIISDLQEAAHSGYLKKRREV